MLSQEKLSPCSHCGYLENEEDLIDGLCEDCYDDYLEDCEEDED